MKFPKIGQFKDIYTFMKRVAQFQGLDGDGRPIYDENLRPSAKIEVLGTVKLHGTNAGLYQEVPAGEVIPMKRSGPFKGFGHFGFGEFVVRHQEAIQKAFATLRENWSECRDKSIAVYGEWAGEGIQKSVGISQFPKNFYSFAVAYTSTGGEDGQSYLPLKALEDFSFKPARRITEFTTFRETIDFAEPEKAIAVFNNLTDKVEASCPVSSALGKENMIGEGIVWSTLGYSTRFKTKGEKHSAGGGKKKASIDPILAATIDKWVTSVVTPDRLHQCYSVLSAEGPLEKKDIGKFVKWMLNDIETEEGDGVAASGLTWKKVAGEISRRSAQWVKSEIEKI